MHGLLQTISSSFATAAVLLVVALLYVASVHFAAKVTWKEAWCRTGLRLCGAKWWGLALAVLPLVFADTWLHYQSHPIDASKTWSPYHVFAGQGLTYTVVAAALSYGVVSAGFAEELLFRGLIAGAFGRRTTLHRANVAQSILFWAPHLLLVPRLSLSFFDAFLIAGKLMALALVLGWLRLSSDSIGPGLVVHGLGNAFVCVLVATL